MADGIDLWITPRPELVGIIERQQAENRALHTAFREVLARLEAERRRHADREAQQQAEIDRLTERVRVLEQKLGAGPPTGGAMPGTKAVEVPPPEPEAPKQPRKARGTNFGWKAPEPTETVDHAVAACPDCGTTLCGGSITRRRTVVELPEAPVRVIEHRYWERVCPQCATRQVPGPELAGIVDGEQRFGVRLISLIVVLREELRVPVRVIRRWLQIAYGLTVSLGSIVAASQRLAKRGAEALAQITTGIRAGPFIQVDETGWRENGRNRYVWIATTGTAVRFLAGTREGKHVDALLGDDFAGVLVSDFYVGYHHYPGRKQRCWAHLLRDIHALTVAHPHDIALQRWARAVLQCYRDAVAETPAPTESARLFRMRALEDRLLLLCAPFWDAPADESDAAGTDDLAETVLGGGPPQRTLCWRIARHIDELFVFVAEPDVPADNNGAERGLRHLVTARKISGGTRSALGTETKVELATLFGTWRLQHRDPLSACLQLFGVSPVF